MNVLSNKLADAVPTELAAGVDQRDAEHNSRTAEKNGMLATKLCSVERQRTLARRHDNGKAKTRRPV